MNEYCKASNAFGTDAAAPMIFARHPAMEVKKLTIGREHAPLLVIDNLLADANGMVDMAASKVFGDVASYYPGIRAKAPLGVPAIRTEPVARVVRGSFRFAMKALRFTACYFSLVTTPPEKLSHLQRIPHIDSRSARSLRASTIYSRGTTAVPHSTGTVAPDSRS